jgi:hypothetical protein
MSEESADDGFTKVLSKAGKKAARFESTASSAAIATKKTHQINLRRQADDISTGLWINSIRAEVAAFENASKTVCLMFYMADAGRLAYDKGTSGYPADIKGNKNGLRAASGVDRSVPQVYAEEHILTKGNGQSNFKYLFSIAFDKSRGQKPACGKCAKFLAEYDIEDLTGVPTNV